MTAAAGKVKIAEIFLFSRALLPAPNSGSGFPTNGRPSVTVNRRHQTSKCKQRSGCSGRTGLSSGRRLKETPESNDSFDSRSEKHCTELRAYWRGAQL